ncbi:ABC transporter substrate-binding protein [Lampropedia puyangensis]|uniref:ABC transporter substrate-binding protein n=2 Tax=Lampropedia puyangensis TaxID=1330072 RepID=A0A4S8FD45_9BURK|nr:ABC transporter substrate-binding protein [Lampropedia puyangensis]
MAAWIPHVWASTSAVSEESKVSPPHGQANTITVTDVLGRQVRIPLPVRRMILEESRQLYTVALLTPEPAAHIVGWGADLQQADPDTYRQYLAQFPQIADIPVLGSFSAATFNIEKAIALQPDVVFLNLETERLAKDSAQVQALERLGIAVVYVDFRHNPARNTNLSIGLFGQILQQTERANAFIALRNTTLARVQERLNAQPHTTPTVFIERIAGLTQDCCFSFGNENFGRYVELAGGRNLAREHIHGTFGQISTEQVLAFDPEVVLLTSGDWAAYNPAGDWIPVGPNASASKVQAALKKYPNKLAYQSSRAARNNRIYAVWHQFYNSPYDFIVVEQLAQWLHPQLFADFDAQANFAQLHRDFLPVVYAPGYFAAIEAPRP